MDGLSGAASVIAVIQITGSICTVLKDYYQGVRDARAEIGALYKAARVLSLILTELQTLIKNKDIIEPQDLLNDCQADLVLLKNQISPAAEEKTRSRYKRYLKWPLKKPDVEKSVATMERHKTALGLFVSLENLTNQLQQLDILEDIRVDVKNAEEEAERRRIIKWLSNNIDPSKELVEARRKHQEGIGTGSWLTSSEDFQKWLIAPNSGYWLNGNAGSGKTILSSTVVKMVQENCRESPLKAVAFWYFTFSDQRKQNVSAFLRSTIAQIVVQRRDLPQELQDAYKTCGQGTMTPNNELLMELLLSILPGFDDFYILVDALDECPRLDGSREDLMKILAIIKRWQESSLHIFVTSRRETDIERAIVPALKNMTNFWIKSLQSEDIMEDVEIFINQALEEHKFRKWLPEFKTEVKQALLSRTQGSFRLVALQLDELRRKAMMPKSKLKKLLDSIPKSLDGFYDRILEDIDPDLVPQAIVAFQWLAFSARPLTLSELREVLSIHDTEEDCLVDPDDKPADNWGVFEILPRSMVAAVEGKGPNKALDERIANVFSSDQDRERWSGKDLVVQLAHFSVKEYFLRSNLKSAPMSKFHFDEKKAHNTIAAGCLSYLLYAARDPCLDSICGLDQEPYRHSYGGARGKWESPLKEYSLLTYSEKCWPRHVEILDSNANKCIESLVLRFVKNDEPAFRMWMASVCHWVGHSFTRSSETPQNLRLDTLITLKSDKPLTYMIWLGLEHVSKILIRHLLPYDQSDLLLVKASIDGHHGLIEVLLDHGIDVNTVAIVEDPYSSEVTALQMAATSGMIEVAKLLVNRGARVNFVTNHGTSQPRNALKSALQHKHLLLVQFLLDNGANVNLLEGEDHVLLDALRAGYSATKLILEAGASKASQQFATRYCHGEPNDYDYGWSNSLPEMLTTLEICIEEVFRDEKHSKTMQ